MYKTKTTLTLLFAFLFMAGSNLTLFGQETAEESSPENEVYELSPFIVDGSSDIGWLATQSQAGTRLRSELRDVAASVSIMNSEFLEDIGVTELQGALAYSVNTESENEFATSDGEGSPVSSLIQQRTRGLVASTTSRNFFKSRLKMDGYNTERLTMARGPNSVLFGLGSPAGVIDGTLKRARLSKKTFGTFAVQVDSDEGHRETLDINVPVMKDFLAMRFGFLNQDRQSYREPEVDEERRKYGTFTMKPWKGATFRTFIEDAQITRYKGQSTLGKDYVSDWIAEGRPLHNYTNGLWTYDDGATWEPWRSVNGYPEPDIDTTSNNNPVYIVEDFADFDVSVYDSIVFDDDDPVEDARIRDTLKERGLQSMVLARTPQSYNTDLPEKTFSDGSIVPVGKNLNGLNSSTDFDFYIKTFVYEQRLTDNLVVEFAYNQEKLDRDFFNSFRGTNIYADVNYYVPVHKPLTDTADNGDNPPEFLQDADGNVILIDNPYRGQFYNESETIGRIQTIKTETYRATISYELKLTDVNRWLGRYNIAGMWEEDTFDDFRIRSRLMSTGDERNAKEYRNGRNAIRNRAYLNLPNASINPPAGAPAYPGTFKLPSENGLEWWDTILGAVHDDGEPELTNRTVNSYMGVVQAYWDGLWNDSLVATLGYRQDEVEFYTGTGAYRAPNTPEGGHEWRTDRLRLKAEPDVDVRGITRTHGLVYHTPIQWLSVIYNKSSNFQPGNGTKNIFNEVIAMRDGEGEEWGIQIQTEDRKYTARVNHFENSSNNAQVSDWHITSLRQNFIGYMEHEIRNTLRAEFEAYIGGTVAERNAWVDAHPDYLPFGGRRWDSEVVATRDFSSEGWELEFLARPIKGLDLRLTVAHTESINSDILTHMQRWLSQTGGTDVNRWSADETRLQVWERYYNRSRSNRTQTVENWEGDTGTVGGKLFADNNRFPRYYEIISGIGFPNQMNRQWRANFTANYRFRDGALKGLSTGFGARWRERAAIGYFPKPNEFIDDPEATLPDITKPVYGKDQFFLDIWFKYQKKIRIAGHPVNWVLHFRVKNPFESSPRVVPQEASYAVDGSVTDWEVEASRTFQLSNSFKF